MSNKCVAIVRLFLLPTVPWPHVNYHTAFKTPFNHLVKYLPVEISYRTAD